MINELDNHTYEDELAKETEWIMRPNKNKIKF